MRANGIVWRLMAGLGLAAGQVGWAQDVNRKGDRFPDLQLPATVPARALSSALGARAAEVASWYGYSPAEFDRLAAQEHSLRADRSGRLFYVCAGLVAPAEAASADAPITQTNYPPEQTFLLASRPGAARTVFLDFDGHVTQGTLWNSNFAGNSPITTPPYDADGNPGVFSITELARIQGIWKRVAEDYMAFDVNVTTADPGVEALRRTTSSDNVYGVRVAIGGSSYDWYGAGAGGVAYIGCFNWNSDTPCFVFTAQLGTGHEKYTAEAVSHEVGHTLGLRHDGTTNAVEYYQGHGNWAPIMGVGYYKNVTQWSKGEYAAANNKEDDLAIMPTYGAPLRADDHADNILSATVLDGWNVSGAGVISTRVDADLFRVQTAAGSVSFTATPATPSPNLDIGLSLYDGTGSLVLGANPTSSLGATLSAAVPAGTYYVAVEGLGDGDPSVSYNDYSSLGEYALSGIVVPGGNQAPVASTAGTTPTAGLAPLTVQFSSASSYDPDGVIAGYDWDFDDGTASAEPNPAKTYASTGTYHASLVVVDDGGLSSAAAVTIVVTNAPPPPPLPAIYVSGISMKKSTKSSITTVSAVVTVKNAAGRAVPGATVSGSWSGVYSGSSSGVTTSRGQATLKTPGFTGRGAEVLTVTGITAPGYQYRPDLNKTTSASIAVP